MLASTMQDSLAVGNIHFHHNPIHTIAWNSRVGREKSKLDYLTIPRQVKSMSSDSHVSIGVDRGSKSGFDHYFLRMLIKRRPKITALSKPSLKVDVSKLVSKDIATSLTLVLTNCFAALADFNDNESLSQTIDCPW